MFFDTFQEHVVSLDRFFVALSLGGQCVNVLRWWCDLILYHLVC